MTRRGRGRPCARDVRDRRLDPLVLRVWKENLRVNGADKIWKRLNRDGIPVARCTVVRLMRRFGIRGAVRGRRFVRTITTDDAALRPADLVERNFRGVAPHRLWVADLTYVKAHTGGVYVAFIVDGYARRVVGWQASRSIRADLAIDALQIAVHNRRRIDDLFNLVHHSDRSMQSCAVRYSERP